MSCRWTATAAAVVVSLQFVAVSAHAQAPLSLADVLARARAIAPQIVSARLAVEEARARLLGADLRLQSNPEVEAALGTRYGQEPRSTDLDLAVSQMFEPPGRRSARRAAATAAVERNEALVAATTRDVLLDAAIAYYRAVSAGERIALFTSAEAIAASTYEAADRRYRAGDIAVLDTNLARIALARVRSERDSAAAERTTALGTLRRILRSEAELAVQPGLPATSAPELSELLVLALQRPELRELEAAVREAEADVQFARSFSRPEVGVVMSYRQEDGDRILGGGIRLTLPVLARAQEQQATGTARLIRLRHELQTVTERIRLEVQSAAAAHEQRLAAVRLLETDAMPGLEENETLAARSFEAGQIGLPDLLVIRRELLEIRFRYLDALLEAVIARVELEAAAGVLR